MKTESATVHDLERSAHCLQWAVVLSFTRISGRLNRRPPVELLRRLLDVFISYTGGSLVEIENAARIDNDPTGGFRRARPGAIALRAAIDRWDGSLPVPPTVAEAAREMVTAYGHRAAGRWDEHTVLGEVDEDLLWPDVEPPR